MATYGGQFTLTIFRADFLPGIKELLLASGKEVRKMVSNTSVSCARNGNGKKIWLFDIDILIDLFSVKIEANRH